MLKSSIWCTLRVQNEELQPIFSAQIEQRKTQNSFSWDILSVYITYHIINHSYNINHMTAIDSYIVKHMH